MCCLAHMGIHQNYHQWVRFSKFHIQGEGMLKSFKTNQGAIIKKKKKNYGKNFSAHPSNKKQITIKLMKIELAGKVIE